MAGRKYEMLRANPHCSFEMDRALGFDFIPERGDVTMRYTCVMGKATATFLETREEKKAALDEIIMARRADTANFAYNQAAIDHVAIVKLTVTEWTAKANPLPKSTAERLNSCD